MIMKEKYDFHFSYELIGSGKKHLITRKKNSNTGYDFDYNLIIDTLENSYRYVAKNVNELLDWRLMKHVKTVDLSVRKIQHLY